MNEIFKTILFQALGYLTAAGLIALLFSFLTRGWFFPYMRARASLGRKKFVMIREPDGWVFSTGRIVDGCLIYKHPVTKNNRRITDLPMGAFTRYIGTEKIMVDGTTNAVLMPNLEGVNGFDAEKQEGLIIRALQLPRLDDKLKVMIILALVVIAGAVAFNLYLTFQQNALLDAIKISLDGLTQGMVKPTG